MAPLAALLLLCCIFLASPAAAQDQDRLLPGSSLNNDQFLTSRNGTTRLGFFSVPGSSQPNQRYLGIWFNDVSTAEFIALWIANRDRPVSRAASLVFTQQGQLQILDSRSLVVWETPRGISATQTTLLDNANLILTAGSNLSNILWQSFDHPADVWVPTMKMTILMNLTSWSSKVSPASGRYVMTLLQSSEYVLSHLKHLDQHYWSSGVWNGRIFANVPQMRYNYFYNFTFESRPPQYFDWYEYSFRHSIFRLEHDGVIRVKWINGEQNPPQWIVVWPVPTSTCDVTEICGTTGRCTSGQLPPCTCPAGFRPENQSEWSNENWSEGCTSTGSGASSSSSSSTGVVIGASVGAAAAVALLLLLGFIFLKRRRSRKGAAALKQSGSVYFVDGELTAFTYKQLDAATDGFRTRLGSGAFGEVFKGSIQGETIAVKRLMRFDDKQFRAEVSTIGTVQHINLVRLRGFCVEESAQRMLVYEFVENGSLDRSLFIDESSEKLVLNWSTRFAIALGTAKGIAYLHEECRDRIIHCDIKPENILLDAEMKPKVGDFGLAKLLGRDFSRVITSMRGTRGYLAPEWLSNLPITPKADVYSYGMMLLEIVSGRRNVDFTSKSAFFPLWAAQQAAAGNFVEIPDERLCGAFNGEQVARAVKTAVWCVQDDEAHRPSMRNVVDMLDGTMESIPQPPLPSSFEVWVEADGSSVGEV